MVLKRDLTPIGRRRGPIVKHKGKGGGPPTTNVVPGAVGGFAPNFNDYTKATPMARPAINSTLPAPPRK